MSLAVVEVAERVGEVLDSLGILKVAGAGLDREYLARWPRELGVEALLARARRESGLEADGS